MKIDQLGQPIDSARIMSYEKLVHQRIRVIFQSLIFPKPYDYADVFNACLMEVAAGLALMDPKLALSCNLADPAKRAAKLAEKKADPEAAYNQAFKNCVVWRIDFFLRRFRYENGFETSAYKRRGKTESLETLLEGYGRSRRNNLASCESLSSHPDMIGDVSRNVLSDDEFHNVRAFYDTVMWLFHEKGADKAAGFVKKLPATERDRLIEHLEGLARPSDVSLACQMVQFDNE